MDLEILLIAAIAVFTFCVVSIKPWKFFLKYIFESSYTSLSKQKSLDLDTRFLSTLHSIITGGGASWILITNGTFLRSDPLMRSTLWSWIVGVSIGYSIFDSLYILINFKAMYSGKKFIDGIIFLVHHALLIVTHGAVIYRHTGLYCSLIAYLFEYTNPFINIRLILIYTNRTKGIFFTIMNFCLVLSFFLFRFLVSPFLLWEVFGPYGSSLIDTSPFVYYIGLFCAVTFLILNFYWCYGVFKVTLKVLKGDEKSSVKQT